MLIHVSKLPDNINARAAVERTDEAWYVSIGNAMVVVTDTVGNAVHIGYESGYLSVASNSNAAIKVSSNDNGITIDGMDEITSYTIYPGVDEINGTGFEEFN